MAYQGDLDLDVASPVAGRSSNASADRQALATLAKKLKAQQAEISSLHQDKRALQVGDIRCMHGCTHCMPVRMGGGVASMYGQTSNAHTRTHARTHAHTHIHARTCAERAQHVRSTNTRYTYPYMKPMCDTSVTLRRV